MTARATRPAGDCAHARCVIEAHFDGEATDVDRIDVETHLDRCAACAAFARELQAVRDAMAELPVEPLDPDALEAVWDRTIRAADDRSGSSLRRWARTAVAVGALAAMIAVAAVTVVLVRTAVVPGPDDQVMSEAHLAQLDADVQAALLIVSDALGRTERIAVVDVLAGQTSPVFDVVGLEGGGTTAESTWSIP